MFRPMLAFAYAEARFVSARKRVSKPARDDVSCDNSRAKHVGQPLDRSVNECNHGVNERKHRIRPVGPVPASFCSTSPNNSFNKTPNARRKESNGREMFIDFRGAQA